MAALVFARPLDNEADDSILDALQAIDTKYAEEVGLESQLSRSSFSFYQRTGHSFIAMQAASTQPTSAQPIATHVEAVQPAAIQGFVLAQSIWNGTRPTVVVNYVAVQDKTNIAAREALLEAVTKSAYDAAVYDLQVIIPQVDTALTQALTEKMYHKVEKVVYERTLGSRGQA